MIFIDGKKYLTEAQWYQKKRKILKRQIDKGVMKEWNAPYIGKCSAIFYTEEQTRPLNKRELEVFKKEKKLERELAVERKTCICCKTYYPKNARYNLRDGLCYYCEDDHTAWQWLSQKHMIPRENAIPRKKYPKGWDWELHDYVEFGDKGWYYYSWDQVRKVSDEDFEKLKNLYIEKFGGWEEIDLEHTTYDGRKWW